MEISATVPIMVCGQQLTEFEAVIEIEVTYWGCRAQTYGPPERCWPAEGPEWEVKKLWVDVGTYDRATKRWKPLLLDCPARLEPDITAWLDTGEGHQRVSDAICEQRHEVA